MSLDNCKAALLLYKVGRCSLSVQERSSAQLKVSKSCQVLWESFMAQAYLLVYDLRWQAADPLLLLLQLYEHVFLPPLSTSLPVSQGS